MEKKISIPRKKIQAEIRRLTNILTYSKLDESEEKYIKSLIKENENKLLGV